MDTGDTRRQSIHTVSPFLASHHGVMDVRNDGVDIRSIVLKFGNDDVGVRDTLMDVRNDCVGVHSIVLELGYDSMGVYNTLMDVRSDYTCADCKFGLEADS